MPIVSINGFKMYYETTGEGFPLVYIHGGFGGLGTVALEQKALTWLDHFTRNFEVITYDRPTARRSSYPEDGFTMQNFTKDVRELLHYLGYDCAHIWGISAGGQIALDFGLQYPEATASLVVTDSAPWLSLDKERKDRFVERSKILNEAGPVAAYEARAIAGTVDLNLFSEQPARSEEEKRKREEFMEQARARLREIPREERNAKYAGELRNYSAYVDWDATIRLKNLKCPILVLYGTEDSVFPEEARTMIQNIQNVEYKAFEGAGHGVAQLPEAIELIYSFLQRHTPAAI